MTSAHPEWILLGALGGLVLALVFFAVFSIAFCVRLKRHDQVTWEKLGCPMPGNWMQYDASSKLLSFLKQRKYQQLHDQAAARLGFYLHVAGRTFLVYVLGACLLVAATLWNLKP